MLSQREQLVEISQQLCHLGLNRGTSGNISVRSTNAEGLAGYLITPSGMPAQHMRPETMVWMDFAGNAFGAHPPSSEWRFHRDILQHKPEINAVIHTHSLYATTLSTLRKDIPAFHYMIAVAGGDTIRCAPYALFGSQALSDHALQALQDRKACLLANHGMIAIGETLEKTLNFAEEVETLCEQYVNALQIGEPRLLTPQEMQEVIQQFKTYGAWAKR